MSLSKKIVLLGLLFGIHGAFAESPTFSCLLGDTGEDSSLVGFPNQQGAVDLSLASGCYGGCAPSRGKLIGVISAHVELENGRCVFVFAESAPIPANKLAIAVDPLPLRRGDTVAANGILYRLWDTDVDLDSKGQPTDRWKHLLCSLKANVYEELHKQCDEKIRILQKDGAK